MSELNYPDYPCVALEGKTRQTTYDEKGLKVENSGLEVMFYRVGAEDDLTHVEQMRDHKDFAVVGFAHLDRIAEQAPYKAKEVASMKRKLNKLVSPPEMKLAALKESGDVGSGKSKKERA